MRAGQIDEAPLEQSQTISDLPVRSMAPRRDVMLRILDDDGILFDAAKQSVYALNTAGTFIWCCLEDGVGLLEICARMRQTFGVEESVARDYVTTALRHWQELQLLNEGPGPDIGFDLDLTAPPRREPRPAAAGRPALSRPAVDCQEYLLLDVGFRLRVLTPALRDEIASVLSPLVVESMRDDPVRLDLVEEGCGWLILRDGRVHARCDRREQVVPLIKTCLVEIALQRSGDFGAVHAAAVVRDGRCLLLAGASGAGKSTITAALVAAGFELMGDDTTVLAHGSLEARPVPFAICLKEGAWGLLASRFPELEERPIHHRLDGKKVRYLPPLRGCTWSKPRARYPVHGLVFLNRVPEAQSAVVPLRRAEALSRLVAEFCPLGEGLTGAKLDALVAWIGRTPAYELRYSPLDDGVDLLAKLCR